MSERFFKGPELTGKFLFDETSGTQIIKSKNYPSLLTNPIPTESHGVLLHESKEERQNRSCRSTHAIEITIEEDTYRQVRKLKQVYTISFSEYKDYISTHVLSIKGAISEFNKLIHSIGENTFESVIKSREESLHTHESLLRKLMLEAEKSLHPLDRENPLVKSPCIKYLLIFSLIADVTIYTVGEQRTSMQPSV